MVRTYVHVYQVVIYVRSKITSQHPTPHYLVLLLAVPCHACRTMPSLSHIHTSRLHTILVFCHTPSHSYSLLLPLTFANSPPLSHTNTHSNYSLHSLTRTFSLNLSLTLQTVILTPLLPLTLTLTHTLSLSLSPSLVLSLLFSFSLLLSYSFTHSLSLHFAFRASSPLSLTHSHSLFLILSLTHTPHSYSYSHSYHTIHTGQALPSLSLRSRTTSFADLECELFNYFLLDLIFLHCVSLSATISIFFFLSILLRISFSFSFYLSTRSPSHLFLATLFCTLSPHFFQFSNFLPPSHTVLSNLFLPFFSRPLHPHHSNSFNRR